MNAATAPAWCRDLPLRGRLALDEPMARHCSWRAGGAAERFYEPADLADLAAYLRAMPADEPVTWLGLGSNLLVRDGGLPGSVIATGRALGAIALQADGRIRAEAGVPCAKVARIAEREGLAGAEFLAGIPGSVGGALAMNAGAFGGEIWPHVVEVETIDRQGTPRRRPAADYRTGYRSVQGPPGEWFTAGVLRFERAPDGAAPGGSRELLAARNATQPVGRASCGSVFKNPPGDHAGRLIEAAGMKGARIGACVVSDKHANFIINEGGARADDIERLILEVQCAVRERFGVELEPEVRIVGVPAAREGAR